MSEEQDLPPEEPAEDAEVPAPAPPPGETPALGVLVPTDSLQRYLAEIRRIPVLSREEEHALAVRWHEQGDKQAAWKLVTSNLRLVVMIAREYQRAFHNLLDLVQEGNIGLLEAIKNFDPYRGIRFPSYAVWWIRAYIIRYIMNNWCMVKVGTTQAQRKLFFNLQKERERLEREGFTPTAQLIAQRLDVREREVVEMEQRLAARDVSVDAPVDEGENATLLDFLPAATQTADAVADEDALRLVVHLGEVGQYVIERFGVAAALGVPLPTAEGRPLPPGDPCRVVDDGRRPLGPARVVDRRIPRAAADQRLGPRDRNG